MRWPKPSRNVTVILVLIQIVLVLIQLGGYSIAVSTAESISPDLQCNTASSQVVLDSAGNIYFRTSYTIQDIGSNTIQVVTLHLPVDADTLAAYDSVGTLSFTTHTTASEQNVNVSLRYPLRGNTGTNYFDEATFTMSYRMNSRTMLSSTSWTQFLLNLQLPTGLNVTIHTFNVKVILPEGAAYQTSSYSGSLPTGGLTPTVEYVFQNTAPLQLIAFTINYEYNLFWSTLRPTFLVGGVSFILGAVIFRVRRGKQLKESITDSHAALIGSFTESGDEWLIQLSELEALEEDFDNKGIGRRDYNRKKMTMQQGLRTVERTLTNLKTEVGQIGPRYAALISRMVKAETAITTLRTDMEKSRAQYRAGRLPRRSYEELKENYRKKIEDAKRDVEGIIIELKREL